MLWKIYFCHFSLFLSCPRFRGILCSKFNFSNQTTIYNDMFRHFIPIPLYLLITKMDITKNSLNAIVLFAIANYYQFSMKKICYFSFFSLSQRKSIKNIFFLGLTPSISFFSLSLHIFCFSLLLQLFLF